MGSGGVPAGVTRDELRAIGSAMLTSLDVRITGRRSQAEVVERMVGRLTAGQVRENVREAIRFIARLRAAAGPWPSALGAAEAALAAAGRDAAPLASLRRVLELLESESLEGSTVRVDLALGRGLQYYTGLVFEITAPGGRPVAGGGRYDDLVELLGGPDTPAVGFTVRVDPADRRRASGRALAAAGGGRAQRTGGGRVSGRPRAPSGRDRERYRGARRAVAGRLAHSRPARRSRSASDRHYG